MRRYALGVVGFVSVANVVSLVLLVGALIDGDVGGDGRALLLSGAGLWITNVLLFAVWYWELDRGGPAQRHLDPDAPADLLFTPMATPGVMPPAWRPGFLDYLYLSLTNATAFSPTDTLPITHTAKAVMALQSVSALLTIGLVIARAVNVLG